MDNKSTNVSPAAVTLLAPMTGTESNRSSSHSINIESGNNAPRSYVTRKRLISFCVLLFIVILIMTLVIGVIMYLSSSKGQTPTTTSLSKPSSSPPSSSTNTDGIVPADTNDPRCQLPLERPCTRETPPETKAEGLGVYYEESCIGVGCRFLEPYCRLCWIDLKAVGRMDRLQCPPCVSAILNKRSW